jgi:thiosulfate reductase cytochrome b subunit
MTIVEKHSLWLRCVHWGNFVFIIPMVVSGLFIYWPNDIYPGFFPGWFYSIFHIDHRLAEGMAIHFTLGWFFVINAVLYGLFTVLSGHWKELVPDRATIRNLIPAILFELNFSKRRPLQGKYNPAQRVAYVCVFLLGVIQVLSGFAIYKPVQLRWLVKVMGGYSIAHAVHFYGMVVLCLFTVVHVIQVARAGWNNLRSMVAGFEVSGEAG